MLFAFSGNAKKNKVEHDAEAETHETDENYNGAEHDAETHDEAETHETDQNYNGVVLEDVQVGRRTDLPFHGMFIINLEISI